MYLFDLSKISHNLTQLPTPARASTAKDPMQAVKTLTTPPTHSPPGAPAVEKCPWEIPRGTTEPAETIQRHQVENL